MVLETIETEGLAHYSYVIGDEREGICAVIDPRRDVKIYQDIARHHKMKISYIFETHIHADFVSGSKELSQKTGAPICVGDKNDYEFNVRVFEEGDSVTLGELNLKIIRTPGHTPEAICLLISGGNAAEHPWGTFTGDTLFAGEIGRPDLLGEENEEPLARHLFNTLYKKLLPLGDEIVIYPAHGKGSPCGANIGDRETTTIGYERKYNPIFQIEEEDKFVKAVLASLSPAPRYYPRLKKVNAKGATNISNLKYPEPMNVEEFLEEMKKSKTVVVDTREIEAYGGAHICGAINIPLRKSFPIWTGWILDETFPIWAGWMLDSDYRILLVLPDDEKLDEAVRQLLRVGYDHVSGYLSNGMRNWIEAGREFKRTQQMSVHELKRRIDSQDNLQVLDVRTEEEYEDGYIPTASHIYTPFLNQHLDSLQKDKPIATYCGSGYRASIAASILEQNGFNEIYNIPGSVSAWLGAGYQLENS